MPQKNKFEVLIHELNIEKSILKCLMHMYTCLRMPKWALFISKLFATCWEMLSKVYMLGYECLGRVCYGLVSGAVVRIGLLWPTRARSLDDIGLLWPFG